MVNVTIVSLWKLKYNLILHSMTSHIISAGTYYHQKYPGSLIFYRLGNSYVAFQEDAERAAKILQMVVEPTREGIPSLSIVHSQFLDTMELITMCGITFRSVIYRDDDGNYAIPDINRLQKEEEMDY